MTNFLYYATFSAGNWNVTIFIWGITVKLAKPWMWWFVFLIFIFVDSCQLWYFWQVKLKQTITVRVNHMAERLLTCFFLFCFVLFLFLFCVNFTFRKMQSENNHIMRTKVSYWYETNSIENRIFKNFTMQKKMTLIQFCLLSRALTVGPHVFWYSIAMMTLEVPSELYNDA